MVNFVFLVYLYFVFCVLSFDVGISDVEVGCEDFVVWVFVENLVV